MYCDRFPPNLLYIEIKVDQLDLENKKIVSQINKHYENKNCTPYFHDRSVIEHNVQPLCTDSFPEYLDGAKDFGGRPYHRCSNLTSVNISNSVTFIGDEAFGECENLTSITVDKGNPEYDSRNNCNAIIHTETNKVIATCRNTIIPKGCRYEDNGKDH